MAAQRQSNDLEMFINYIIETGDKRSAKEEITVTVSNPTRDNFLLAKQLVYNAMRLIDDEIGIFHKRLDNCERPGRGSITIGSSHYDIWEKVRFVMGVHRPDITLPFGINEPGDKIHLFHEERRKFFSFVPATFDENGLRDANPGPLFLLPRCFYFTRPGLPLSSMTDERGVHTLIGSSICRVDNQQFSMTQIKRASMIARRFWKVPVTEYDDEIDYCCEHRDTIRDDCSEGAFRIVARELFFNHASHMFDALFELFYQVSFDDDE